MKVLLTNNALDAREGSETYLMQVAANLKRRGHVPYVYSTCLGKVAKQLRDDGVYVTNDLHTLSEHPDVIHGQHHIETMSALSHFPEAPVIAFCHGVLPWQEYVQSAPNVRRYVAVDVPCRNRLIDECGIDEKKIELLLNFVDMDRFANRPSLPKKPKKALVFSNSATEGQVLNSIRSACSEMHIEVDVVGLQYGNPSDAPEKLLKNYDVVFAKALAAQEAIATGCAVILCNYGKIGPLVTTKNYSKLRPLNFGFRCLEDPVTKESVLNQLAQYDAADSTAVSQQYRRDGDAKVGIERLLCLYENVIRENKADGGIPPFQTMASVSDYIVRLGQITKNFEAELSRQQLHRIEAERALHEITKRSELSLINIPAKIGKTRFQLIKRLFQNNLSNNKE